MKEEEVESWSVEWCAGVIIIDTITISVKFLQNNLKVSKMC